MAIRKKLVKKQLQKKPTTYYFLVLDESSSMGHLKEDVKRLYVEKINALYDEAESNGQQVRGSLIKFAYKPNKVVLRSDRDSLIDSHIVDGYRPSGNTCLFDAVAEAIQSSKDVDLKSNDAVLIEVITDGEENCSVISGSSLLNQIRSSESTGQYTFVFQVPMGYKAKFIRDFGFPADNIREWETTRQGWQETARATNDGFKSYMCARGQGQTQTCNFYAPIDVSDVDNSDLKKLDNVTSRFKTFDVDGEIPIKDFVEKKANQVYKNGCAFYELSKDELIRPGRELVIAEKNKHTLYGGSKVRTLLGLPAIGNVKVSPYNLGKYRIFAQSSSVNRKLVRGTKVLVDVNQQKILAPTWGV